MTALKRLRCVVLYNASKFVVFGLVLFRSTARLGAMLSGLDQLTRQQQAGVWIGVFIGYR